MTGVRWEESIRRKVKQGIATIQNAGDEKYVQAIDAGINAHVSQSGGLVLNDDNDESRRMVEMCYRTHKTLVNPIIDWKEEDVWEFLNEVAKVPHCELYDQGMTRLGCIGCPMSNWRMVEHFKKYPKHKDAYIRAFDRMVKVRNSRGKTTQWKSGQEVFDWWVDKFTRKGAWDGIEQADVFEMMDEELYDIDE